MLTVGEVAGLLTALTWATSSMLVKALTRHFTPIPLTALRLSVGAIFIFVVLSATNQLGSLGSLPASAALGLGLSTVIGTAGGDVLFTAGLKSLPMAIAFPVSVSAFVVITTLVSVAFLGEPIGPYLMLGLPLTLVGLYLISSAGRPKAAPGQLGDRWKGVAVVLVSALFWAASISVLKLSIGQNSVLAANAVRLPIGALVMLGLAFQVDPGSLRLRRYGRSVWTAMVAAGVLGYGVGALFFVASVQNAGAARAALLSSVAPLFALPLSIVFLKEKVTLAILVGTLLTVAGIVLVLLD